MKKTFDLIATAAAGLEAVVGREIRNLGIDCQVENGRVRFEGSFALAKPIDKPSYFRNNKPVAYTSITYRF